MPQLIQFGYFEPSMLETSTDVNVPMVFESEEWTPIPGVYSPPKSVPGVYYTSVSTEGHTDRSLRRAIGKDGCVWKAISYKTGALYIWNNNEEKTIEVWGPLETIAAAASRVRCRLDLILDQVQAEEAAAAAQAGETD